MGPIRRHPQCLEAPGLGLLFALALFFSCNKSDEAPAAGGASAAAAPVAALSAATEGSSFPERSSVPPPVDVAAAPEAAEKLEGDVATVLLTKGSGTASPKDIDRVKVHYTGWTRDGRMLVSTQIRNRPHTLPMDRLKQGWEGMALSKMVAGEKRRFWVPAGVERSGFSRRANKDEAVTFDLELVEIIEVPQPPEVPDDVAKAPKDAKRTKSGIAYKVLKKGTGTTHPTAEQRVDVHYTGWTPDGKMFDSSVPRGRPSTFALNQVIKGWTEGVQLMVEGEKTRFWIPGELAYGDKPSRPGSPAGDLVFDVELLKLH
jgi:FKBP-type peptidyl-prolyl cis-trans isomerase